MKNWYRILILFLVSSSLLTFTAAAQQKNTDTERALVLKLAAYLKDSSYTLIPQHYYKIFFLST